MIATQRSGAVTPPPRRKQWAATGACAYVAAASIMSPIPSHHIRTAVRNPTIIAHYSNTPIIIILSPYTSSYFEFFILRKIFKPYSLRLFTFNATVSSHNAFHE